MSLKRKRQLLEIQLNSLKMKNNEKNSDSSSDVCVNNNQSKNSEIICQFKNSCNENAFYSNESNDLQLNLSERMCFWDYDRLILIIVIDQINQAFETAKNHSFLVLNPIAKQNEHRLDNFCTIILESFRLTIKNFISYIKILPGLNEICHDDLEIVVKEKLFEFFIIINVKQFINDECFIMLPNGQRFKNSLIEKYLGFEFKRTLFEIVDKINNLNLSCKELSIFLSIILTNFGNLKNIDCILIEFLFIYFNN